MLIKKIDNDFRGYTYNLKMVERLHFVLLQKNQKMNEIGKWVEKEVFENRDFPIYSWQSARCSICGKYHTTPYEYYFDNFNYCPNCGSKMTTKKEDKNEQMGFM